MRIFIAGQKVLADQVGSRVGAVQLLADTFEEEQFLSMLWKAVTDKGRITAEHNGIGVEYAPTEGETYGDSDGLLPWVD